MVKNNFYRRPLPVRKHTEVRGKKYLPVNVHQETHCNQYQFVPELGLYDRIDLDNILR